MLHARAEQPIWFVFTSWLFMASDFNFDAAVLRPALCCGVTGHRLAFAPAFGFDAGRVHALADQVAAHSTGALR